MERDKGDRDNRVRLEMAVSSRIECGCGDSFHVYVSRLIFVASFLTRLIRCECNMERRKHLI